MSVGIAQIDEDHKRFIALVNEFNKSVENRLGVSEVQRILRDILDDAIEHFANEERLLGEWRYPGAHDHARAHAELVLQLRQIESAISTDYDMEWVEAGLKIKEALIDHIQTEDIAFAEYCRNSRGVPPAGAS